MFWRRELLLADVLWTGEEIFFSDLGVAGLQATPRADLLIGTQPAWDAMFSALEEHGG